MDWSSEDGTDKTAACDKLGLLVLSSVVPASPFILHILLVALVAISELWGEKVKEGHCVTFEIFSVKSCVMEFLKI